MRAPRPIGRVHWRGLWAVYRLNVVRFARVALEGLVGPVMSALLLLIVFSVAIGGTQTASPGIAFVDYLAPGVAALTLVQVAFANAAFPIVFDKLEGTIQDLLASPLLAWEIAAGYTLAAATAGLTAGGLTLLVVWPFIDLPMSAPWTLLAFAAMTALLFAILGAIVGLWADRWDRLAAVNTFMMLPLAFLSGAFFAPDSLPELGRAAIGFNPAFYMIDGMRFGVLGVAQAPMAFAAALTVIMIVLTAAILWRLFQAGYKIKP